MKALSVTYVVALLLSTPAFAREHSGKAPSGKIAYAVTRPEGDSKLRIWDPRNPKKRVLLYEATDGLFIYAVSISPDGRWIAVEHGGGSAGHDLTFFKRTSGLSYRRVGEEDDDYLLGEKIAETALQGKGVEFVVDHSYLSPLKWSADSKWLTVSLSGRGGGELQIMGWRCQYNPDTKAVRSVKPNPGKMTGGKAKE